MFVYKRLKISWMLVISSVCVCMSVSVYIYMTMSMFPSICSILVGFFPFKVINNKEKLYDAYFELEISLRCFVIVWIYNFFATTSMKKKINRFCLVLLNANYCFSL